MIKHFSFRVFDIKWIVVFLQNNTGVDMKKNEPIPATELHLGKLIKAELERQGRTAVWLAKQANCTPENIYKACRSQWLTMPLLFKISRALGYDFFKDCSKRLNVEES